MKKIIFVVVFFLVPVLLRSVYRVGEVEVNLHDDCRRKHELPADAVASPLVVTIE